MPAEAAVAKIPTRWAPPRVARVVRLVHVLAVSHPEAVAAELPPELAASPAGSVLADRLLPALMARGAPHRVVYPVALRVVTVHEERPGLCRCAERLLVGEGVSLLVVHRLPEIPIGSVCVELGGVILGDLTGEATASALDRGALDPTIVTAVRQRRVSSGVASSYPLGIGGVRQGIGGVKDSESHHPALVLFDSCRALRLVRVDFIASGINGAYDFF
mmetsp:Transcript_6950/g.31646  ORF Transcript_6950/g.31646 Transcript_6950/m.31646 type:complete len:218 (+) Transcript_6950:1637-2290(+)